MHHGYLAVGHTDVCNPDSEEQLGTVRGLQLGQLCAHGGVVDDVGRFHPERRDCGDVRLELSGVIAGDQPGWSAVGHRALMQRLQPRGFGLRHGDDELSRATRPTAAFCANDLLALGLLQQCVSLGVGVPGDLAIVGYDDIEFAAAAAVPLTSVRQPRRDLGCTAAELLLNEASNPDHEHQQVLFTPELVARSSTLARPG